MKYPRGQRPHNKLTDEAIARIVEQYRDGVDAQTIADDVGTSVRTVYNHLRRMGVEVHRPSLQNRLSPEQGERIVSLYGEGKTMSEVAEIIGTSYTSVYNCLKRNGVASRSSHSYAEPHSFNEHFFDEIDTEEKAYFLGFLYADGCLLQDRHHTVRINLHKKDRAILERFRDLLESTSRLYEFKTLNQFCLQVPSRHMWERLRDLGCPPKKTLILTYPDWMPGELEHNFIRGYFDGDGTVGRYDPKVKSKLNGADWTPRIAASMQGTRDFCEGVADVLTREIGESPRLYATGKGGGVIYNLTVAGPRKTLRFMEYLYRDATIYLERKREVFRTVEAYCEKVDRKLAEKPKVCTICGGKLLSRGFCRKHYVEWKKTDPDRPRCSKCQDAQYAKGLCERHYSELRHHGEDRPRCRVCERPAIALGLCQRHYKRKKKENG